MAQKRLRLDELLAARGLAESRAKAKACVMAGQVRVDGRLVTKAGAQVNGDAVVEVRSPCPYVSRGGLKLAAALKAFPITVSGRVCLDAGASTGGFTDCLLQAGAARVYAVDVGRAQLHAKLRADSRVVSLEKTHARDLVPGLFSPQPDLAVVDVSFISLVRVLPPVLACLKPPFEAAVLVKPQFEVGPKLAPKGVVRSPQAREGAVAKIRACLEGWGVQEVGRFESPVHGPKGNIETFLHLKSA